MVAGVALRRLRRIDPLRANAARANEVAALATRRFTPRTLVECRFGRDLALLGYDVEERAPRGLAITYYWRAERPIRSVYAMSRHFVGATFRFQDDCVFGTPAGATASWEAGDVVKQMRVVRVPDDAPDGRYRFDVGAWKPATRRHLTVDWRGREKHTLLDLDVAGAQAHATAR